MQRWTAGAALVLTLQNPRSFTLSNARDFRTSRDVRTSRRYRAGDHLWNEAELFDGMRFTPVVVRGEVALLKEVAPYFTAARETPRTTIPARRFWSGRVQEDLAGACPGPRPLRVANFDGWSPRAGPAATATRTTTTSWAPNSRGDPNAPSRCLLRAARSVFRNPLAEFFGGASRLAGAGRRRTEARRVGLGLVVFLLRLGLVRRGREGRRVRREDARGAARGLLRRGQRRRVAPRA